MSELKDYEEIVGKAVIKDLKVLAKSLQNKRIVMINSTKEGGGVAEILNSLVPLFNKLGIETHWLVLKGNNEFFSVTKSFHNALQGDTQKDIMEKIMYYKFFYRKKFNGLNKDIITYFNNLKKGDIVIIHDPQPIALIKYRNKSKDLIWLWRKHIDTGNPNPKLWDFIYDLAKKYDKIIASKEEFIHGDRKKYIIIPPSIDPLTEKNQTLYEEEINETLKKFKIPTDKPFFTQVSRLDKWKDPVGVIEAFRKARDKSKKEFRLILKYAGAADDPEGDVMFEKVMEAKKGKYEEDIYLVSGDDQKIVNVLQRKAIAVLQKSLKEGFALTVSEALWKSTPVIASDVGGIPLQVKHGINGYLVKGYKVDENGNALNKKEREKHLEKVSDYMIDIIENPEKAKEMGKKGREHVKKNFLTTLHARQYLQLFNILEDLK